MVTPQGVVSGIKSLKNSTAHACSFAFVPTRVRLLRRPVSNLTCNQNFTSYHSFLGLKLLKNVTMPWCNSSRKLDSLKIMNILLGRKNKELSRSLCRHFRRQKCAFHFQIVNWSVWSCLIVLFDLAVYLWSFDVTCPLGSGLGICASKELARRPIPTKSYCAHDCQGGFIKHNKKASDWSIQGQA